MRRYASVMARRRRDVRAAVRQLRGVPLINRAATGLARKVAGLNMRMARSLELHSIRSGEVQVALPNGADLVLWSGDGDYWASRYWWHGWDAYEPETLGLWFRLAERASTVLDVGANVGIFALVAGLANPRASCYAFEPLPASCEVLRRNTALNPAARVTVVPAAVGAVDGSTEIFWDASRRHDLMATVAPGGRAGASELTSQTVPMVALDSWASTAHVDKVDLVKIDVEGHERDVLAGMSTLLTSRPDLIIEVLDEATATAVREIAARHGYDHYLLTPVGPIKTEQIAPHVCLNHLLTTRDEATIATL